MGSRGPVGRKNAKSVRTDAGVRLRQLPNDADTIFKRLAKDINGLSAADVALLELMSYWMEIAKDCRAQLARPESKATSDDQLVGLVLTVADTTHGDGTEERKNPLLIVLRTATEQIRALAAQLGASPMARARLPEVEDSQASFGDDFFRAAAAALNAKNRADGIR
jgi:phage terminase small subunit